MCKTMFRCAGSRAKRPQHWVKSCVCSLRLHWNGGNTLGNTRAGTRARCMGACCTNVTQRSLRLPPGQAMWSLRSLKHFKQSTSNAWNHTLSQMAQDAVAFYGQLGSVCFCASGLVDCGVQKCTACVTACMCRCRMVIRWTVHGAVCTKNIRHSNGL